jgi:Mg2+ and Co2+ transporter CorA
MITYLRSTSHRLQIKKTEKLLAGSWIRAEKPSEEDIKTLVALGFDSDILNDALDPHEVPRVELEGEWIYFITRLPRYRRRF